MIKCYLDGDGNTICSDEYLFPENPEDIIDNTYIKEVYYIEPQEIYKDILKESYEKKLFKGML